MRKIFFWVELVAGLRILLFTVPVLLQRPGARGADAHWEQTCLWLLTGSAVLYAAIAVVSLCGSRAWRRLHGGVAALSFLGGAGFLIQALNAGMDVPGYFYFPVVLAVMVGAGTLGLGTKQSG